MAETSPSKIVIDLTKCNKRACIFERTKKQNKVDPLNGLEIGNHPYFRNYTQYIYAGQGQIPSNKQIKIQDNAKLNNHISAWHIAGRKIYKSWRVV